MLRASARKGQPGVTGAGEVVRFPFVARIRERKFFRHVGFWRQSFASLTKYAQLLGPAGKTYELYFNPTAIGHGKQPRLVK
jgi:hypothetical protein